jgi:dTDP-4-dehydrorhamnose 3,5-epimerase
VDRAGLDVTDREAVQAWPWSEHDVVVNAAAYTAVDKAETAEGRAEAWAVNAEAAARLARLATSHGFTLVHYSTDYVFDGTREVHDEDEPLTPLSVYGQSKAAGDVAVAVAPRHYLLRASWVVGDGGNFVRTMARVADSGSTADVVGDQIGRLTFADELARATRHLVDTHAPWGTYHVSNGGPPVSWADVAREVFAARGRDPHDVREISSDEYAAGRSTAPRPRSSVLSLEKLAATGFEPADAREALRAYCASCLP